MNAMPTIHWQPMAMTGAIRVRRLPQDGLKSDEEIKALRQKGETHGTASCDACHTRHLFSKEEARQPHAARPATWASTTRSGRCTRAASTACAAPSSS
jgi:hypothetical protein